MRIQSERLNPILRVVLGVVLCFLTVLLSVTQAEGQDQPTPKKQTSPNVQATVEVGAQIVDRVGDHDAKFQETRDVPAGFFIQKFKLDLNHAESPYFLRLNGFEILQDDQRFTFDAGKFGKYRTQFVFDQIPHNFGDGKSFLVKTGPGLYQVSPTLRASLQAVTLPDAGRTPVNAALPNLVRQELLTAPVTRVRLRRDQAMIRQSYEPTDNIELHAQFSWLRNRGSRPMGAGTFVRRAAPGGGLTDTGGLWEGIGQEFLEPIDQRTYALNVGAQFFGKKWSAGVDYDLSLFRNKVESLIFENPFRVTDEQGCTPNAPPLTGQTCGAQNRFRQVRWQNDLAPNNDSHTLTFWARFDLTPQTQIRGLFSLAYWTQNDPFLPWTLNTAIKPTDWDALSPITDPTDVNQLPARSLNGKMRDINQEYAIVNRSKSFQFQAQYRSQSVDNQTASIFFPGYAAFGDSTWRAPRTDFYNLPIENLDWDFRHQNIQGGFRWDVRRHITWKVDYDWEIWNRKFRDVNRSNQHSIRNRLDFEFNFGEKKGAAAGQDEVTTVTKTPAATEYGELDPVTTLRLKLDYRYANRRALVYNTQPLTFCPSNVVAGNPALAQCATATGAAPANSPQGAWVVTSFTTMNDGFPIEFNLLRRFDEASRTLNDGRVDVEFVRGPNTNFSGSYRYLAEGYDKNLYGRLFNRYHFVDLQLTQAFENGSYLYVTYSREMNTFRYRDLAHLLPNPAAPPGAIVQGTLAQYPIANTWERTSRNSLDSFEFGFNAAPQEGKLKKWEFDLEYAFSFARDKITTINPFPVRADSVLHAGANPYPDTVVRRHDLNLSIARKINERLDVGVRYWYEPYFQDDFSFNNQQPYMHGLLPSDTPKYLFQDARYGTYHANVGTVFVRYTF